MRAPFKAESQSEAIIGLRLFLPREGTTGLARGSEGRLLSQVRVQVLLLFWSSLQAANS